MKKVVFLHHVSSIGGASFCLLSILKAIDRNKITPIVCLRNPGPLKEQLEQLGINVYLFSNIWQVPYNQSLFNLRTIRSYVKILFSLFNFKLFLKSLNADVLYINTLMLYPYLKVAKDIGMRTIIHVREHWPMNEHKNQLGWASNALKSYADQIVAINSYSAEMFSESGYKTTIVYDWIDMRNRYKKIPFEDIFGEDTKELKVFVYTGGMQKIKGAYEVISSFTHKIKNDEARLLLLGDYNNSNGRKGLLTRFKPDSYSQKVLDLIKRDTRIKVIPSTYDILHILQQAYCFVNYFTKPHANLGMAECIISGTVSIVAKTPEAEEYSNNGKMAILCDDLDDFILKWSQIDIIYPSVKDNIRLNNHIIADKFDKQNNVRRLENIIYNI